MDLARPRRLQLHQRPAGRRDAARRRVRDLPAPERAHSLAAQLRAIGCRLALDDFGAGFASFYYLKHLPVDVVKIDGEFVRDICHDATSEAVVRAIVQTATAVGSTTVAECVESEECFALLRDLGVDAAQGYDVGKPRALDDLW